MATKTDIITLPHPHLRQVSKSVRTIDEKITTIIQEMKEATLDWEDNREHEVGVALAAVQIDRLQRIVIVRKDFDDRSNRDFDIYINPEITRFEGVPVEDYEGCLSIENIYGLVRRYPKIKVKAQNEHGKTVKFIAKGFLARVFQHEIDHTNGVPFVDHLGPEAQFYKINPEGAMTELPKAENRSLVEKLQIV